MRPASGSTTSCCWWVGEDIIHLHREYKMSSDIQIMQYLHNSCLAAVKLNLTQQLNYQAYFKTAKHNNSRNKSHERVILSGPALLCKTDSCHHVWTVCLYQALGGLAYQAFYQRILSASSYTQAQVTCFASSAFCLVLGIPSVLVGAVAASTGTHS